MRARVAAVLAVVVVTAWAGSASPAAAASKKATTTTVATTLIEFKVKPTPKQAKAGTVVFKVKNAGAVEHELVVVATPPGTTLYTKPDGSLDETQLPAGAERGRVDLQPKKSGTVKASGLSPGSYLLFCNLETTRPDGTSLSHYKLGMHATFKVK